MAQKREKEETELNFPESIPLCSPNLPIAAPPPPPHLAATGSRSTEISDLSLLGNDKSRSNSTSSPEIIDPKLPGRDESRSSSDGSPERIDPKLSGTEEMRSTSAKTMESTDLLDRKAAVKRPREATRCSGTGCRKKVGLMPFRCRCGEVFCSEHRYSDRHDCSYDYKAAGREAIARDNPVVKAAKILKF